MRRAKRTHKLNQFGQIVRVDGGSVYSSLLGRLFRFFIEVRHGLVQEQPEGALDSGLTVRMELVLCGETRVLEVFTSQADFGSRPCFEFTWRDEPSLSVWVLTNDLLPRIANRLNLRFAVYRKEEELTAFEYLWEGAIEPDLSGVRFIPLGIDARFPKQSEQSSVQRLMHLYGAKVVWGV